MRALPSPVPLTPTPIRPSPTSPPPSPRLRRLRSPRTRPSRRQKRRRLRLSRPRRRLRPRLRQSPSPSLTPSPPSRLQSSRSLPRATSPTSLRWYASWLISMASICRASREPASAAVSVSRTSWPQQKAPPLPAPPRSPLPRLARALPPTRWTRPSRNCAAPSRR